MSVGTRGGGGRRRARLLGELLAPVAVLGLALLVFGLYARLIPFDGDEAFYIWESRYFGYLFLQHDVSRPEWGDNYATHTQPMMQAYLIGASLWARGYDLEAIPDFRFDWSSSLEQNRAEGRVPDDALLAAARAPMVLVASGAVVALYLLGRLLGGIVAGLAAAALAVFNDLGPFHLLQARNEAPLAFFLLLALLLGLLGLRRGSAGGLQPGWAVGVGVALGLGIGSKLTAVLSLVAVAVWLGLTLAAAAWRQWAAGAASIVGQAWTAGRGWLLALAVAVGVFVLSDPHLYPDPLAHTVHLFQGRARDLEAFQAFDPTVNLYDPVDRVQHVLAGSLVKFSPLGSRGYPVEALLALLGALALGARAWRGWRESGGLPAEGLVLTTVLAYFAGVSAFLAVDWTRYYLPTWLLGTLLGGLGVSVLIRSIPLAVAALRPNSRAAREHPQPT
jgi:hypothetical protein